MIDLLACVPPQQVVVIEAAAPSLVEAAIETILEPLRPLREQFTAITGAGLEIDDPDDLGLRRRTLPARDGRPPISYLTAGASSGRRIVFIHGSPGAGEEWGPFLINVPAAQFRIAPDRPGFGSSEVDEPVGDLAAQAESIRPLLGPEGSAKAVLVGYSYGGALALRTAIDNPGRVGAILLVGSAADPDQEEVHPLQAVAATEIFAQLLPSELANSNAELLALKPQLERLEDDLPRLNVPVSIMQGLRDTLVPPQNAEYLQSKLTSNASPRTVLIEDGDHFLPWTHQREIIRSLACLVDELDAAEGVPPVR